MEYFFEFLLFAVPIGAVIGTPIYLTRRKINALQCELAEERGQNRTAQIATEKTALEERVRVLERIVTSRGYSLAEEIDALRDMPELSAETGVPLQFETKEMQP